MESEWIVAVQALATAVSDDNDLMFGATAIVAVETIETMDDAKKIVESKKFNDHRKVVGARLVDRVNEPIPHLDEAMERLRSELPAVRDTNPGHGAAIEPAE